MKKIKVALVGLGVVGKSVYDILIKDQEIINSRTAAKLELVAVSARSKKDFIDETKVKFVSNILDLAHDPEIAVIVEVVGGEGIIYDLHKAALKNGKKIVTANKALLALHGLELVRLAEENNGSIAFEAAVAGAIPIVKTFKEGLAANKINEFYGILNGTCNYILTKMAAENLGFAEALQQAQALGYAESDPSADVDGIDTAHKLVLLASIATSSQPNFAETFVEGITKITADDIRLADEFGYKIKLLAVYKNATSLAAQASSQVINSAAQDEKSSSESVQINAENVFQAVYPALVAKSEKIANVDDSFNAVLSKASNADYNLAIGRGAGGFPTASAVVADLIDIANNRHAVEFGVKSAELINPTISKIEERVGRYFITLTLDKKLLHEQKLDEKFLQEIKVEKTYFYEKDSLEKNDENIEVICGLLTFAIAEKSLLNLLKNLDKNLVKEFKFLRVEETGF